MEAIIINKKNPEENSGIGIYDTIQKMRSESSEFNDLLTNINSQFQKFTSSPKNYESHLFKPHVNICIPTSLVLTSEQKSGLYRYVYDKYIDIVPGDLFIIRKRYFSKGYRIRSFYNNNIFSVVRSLI